MREPDCATGVKGAIALLPDIRALRSTRESRYNYGDKIWCYDDVLGPPEGAQGTDCRCWAYNVVPKDVIEPAIAVVVLEPPSPTAPVQAQACTQAVCPDGPSKPNKVKPDPTTVTMRFKGGVNATQRVIRDGAQVIALILDLETMGNSVLDQMQARVPSGKPKYFHVYGVVNLPGFEGTDMLVAIPVG
jgi:hypothetical protein